MNIDSVAGLEKYLDHQVHRMRQTVSKAITQLESNIVLATPVDSGNARARWHASINQPESDQHEWTGQDADPEGAYRNMVYHMTPTPAYHYAIAKNRKAIDNAGGNIFYLTNDTEYIDALEKGRADGNRFVASLQAPLGFVRRYVPNFDKYLEDALRKVK